MCVLIGKINYSYSYTQRCHWQRRVILSGVIDTAESSSAVWLTTQSHTQCSGVIDNAESSSAVSLTTQSHTQRIHWQHRVILSGVIYTAESSSAVWLTTHSQAQWCHWQRRLKLHARCHWITVSITLLSLTPLSPLCHWHHRDVYDTAESDMFDVMTSLRGSQKKKKYMDEHCPLHGSTCDRRRLHTKYCIQVYWNKK